MIMIAHQSIITGDAIGHDILGMLTTLSELGHKVALLCEHCEGDLEQYRVDTRHGLRLVQQAENVLIYHHSILWPEGESLLRSSKCSVMFKYHNITPPEFFAPYSEIYRDKSERGRKQTAKIVKMFPNALWLGDSAFNNRELSELGVRDQCLAVVPPFHELDKINSIPVDQRLLRSLKQSDVVNVLFVGRVAPNKGHKLLVEAARWYTQLFGRRIKFWVAGGIDSNLIGYVNEVTELIREYKLTDTVHFTGRISSSTLKSLFLGSDVFLCLSEHEGFCVPLIEAQYFSLPVLAVNNCAIGETVGSEQLCFKDFSPEEVAASIYVVGSNQQVSDYLNSKAILNYEKRFHIKKIKTTFLNAIQPYI